MLAVLEESYRTSLRYFVFPSQVAADFWRRKLLDSASFGALEWERFLSWDSFKESLFSLQKKELPANQRVRRLFSADLLSRFSRGEESFRVLLNPQYRKNAGTFQSYIAAILPGLESFWDGPAKTLAAGGNQDSQRLFLADLRYLTDAYRRFLEKQGLYEPSWERPPLGGDGKSYLIFFPELIEDFREFEKDIAGSPAADCLGLDFFSGIEEERTAAICLYPRSREELETFCVNLGALLDQGLSGGEVAVTLADPSLRPSLEHCARLYNVPLSFRAGTPLADFPEGRFFSRLRTCREEDFSLSSMKALLLNRAYPWKNPRLLEQLLLFGGENYCYRNLSARGGGPHRDIWEQALRRFRNEEPQAAEEMEAFYLSFRNQVKRLCASADFRELARHLEVFLRSFLDTDAWEPSGLAVLQRIRLALGELALLEDRLGGLSGVSPLDFFIQDLESKNYVAQEEEPGIPVFDYRVSAGIFPKHHFVLGLSQRASEVEKPAFAFLSEDQRSLLGLEEGRLDGAFLRAYAVSGQTVSISCAAESSQGPELVPRGFRVLEAPGFKKTPGPAEDPYEAEILFWEGKRESLPESFSPVQALGLERARETVFAPGKLDLTRDTFDNPALLDLVLGKLSAEEAESGPNTEGTFLRVSATWLDDWKFCPFFFLLKYAFELDELAQEARWESPRDMGILRHNHLQAFFENLKDEPFDEEKLKPYQKIMDDTAGDVFRYWESRKTLPLSPFWDQFQRKLRRELSDFLAAEGGTFSGWRVFALEKEFSLTRGGLKLSGRVDRVSEKAGAFLLVDYKTRQRQGEKSMIDSQGEPFSYQMPFYLILLEEEGGRVETAAYYDFSENRYKFMIRDGGEDGRQLVESLKEKTWAALADFRLSALRGDWRPPEDCGSCAYRSVCRKRYVLRGAERG